MALLDERLATGFAIRCAHDCGSPLVAVDRYAADAPPGPRGESDWLEFYRDEALDPDDRMMECPGCGNWIEKSDLRASTPEDLARRLVATARSIGEPCGGAQCWIDLRDEFPGMGEQFARAIVNAEVERAA